MVIHSAKSLVSPVLGELLVVPDVPVEMTSSLFIVLLSASQLTNVQVPPVTVTSVVVRATAATVSPSS